MKTVAAEGNSQELACFRMESKNAGFNDKQLLMNSGADVYVIVDLQKTYLQLREVSLIDYDCS